MQDRHYSSAADVDHRSLIGIKNLRFPIELLFPVLLGALALTANISAPPLLDWDEATYAEVAHEALHNGQFLDLTWNGVPYVKKPPLLFWMVVGSFKTFGESEAAARLPSVVAGLGTLVLIYLSAAPVIGPLGGLLASLFPLGFYFFIARGGRECATDAPMIFFSTLAIYGLSRSQPSPQAPDQVGQRKFIDHRRLWLTVAGIACGLAILSKGLAGVIPLIVAVAAAVCLPGLALGWTGVAWLLAASTFTAGPWYLYEALFNTPAFVSSFIGHETLHRMTSHLEDDRSGADFALITFAGEVRYLWPLVFPLAALLIANIRGGLAAAVRRLPPALGVWLLWLAIALGCACAVQTRLPWYVLPALIPAALVAGAIPAYALQRGALTSIAGALAILALAMITAGAPKRWRIISWTARQQRARSMPSYVLALRAREAADAGGELFFAGVPLPTLVYYSGMRCNFVETSELTHVELVGADFVPDRIQLHDLVLLDSTGRAQVVANFDDEWHWSREDEPRQPPAQIEDFDQFENLGQPQGLTPLQPD